MERFAIYFAPADGTRLAAFGAAWFSGAAWRDWSDPTPARMTELLASPRHYGFHATLKPPFALADGADRTTLMDRVAAFASDMPAVSAPPLTAQQIGRFIALRPGGPAREIDDLAGACVEAFDDLRRPADAAELAKRRAAGLTQRQERLLTEWGYPYVFEEFRFHMTLTGPCAAEGEAQAILRQLAPLTAELAVEPFHLDAVCVFHQGDRAAEFNLLERFSLTGDVASARRHTAVTPPN